MAGLAINLADALFISNEALPFGYELRFDVRNKASGLFILTSVRGDVRLAVCSGLSHKRQCCGGKDWKSLASPKGNVNQAVASEEGPAARADD